MRCGSPASIREPGHIVHLIRHVRFVVLSSSDGEMAVSEFRVRVMPMPLFRLFLLFALVPGAAHADKNQPWSEIHVGDVAAGEGGEHDLLMIAINGSRDVPTLSVYKLPPGMQSLRLASEKRVAGGAMTSQTISLELRPCMRYELVADHSKPEAGRSWRPEVKSETPIKACRKKFGEAVELSRVP
jgi:hypothetical protein